MGTPISTLKHTIPDIIALLKVLRSLVKQYRALLQRATSDPGLPVPHPTSSFWLDDPPFPHLSSIQQEPLPVEADVVIIGSGITAASVARCIADLASAAAPPPRIVVCEARHLCAGATGRNGGHVKTVPYEVFATFEARFGGDRARALVEFQRRHLGCLQSLGEAFPEGEVRAVDTVDLFVQKGDFEKAKRQVDDALRWGVGGCEVWEAEGAREKFGVNDTVVGAISYAAGALWPYRLVTAIWNDLVERYPSLSLNTNTPVESITITTTDTPSSPYPYLVTTSRGRIRARHVVHASNAFAPHLLPSLRGSLTGALAHMSQHQPGPSFASSFPASGGGQSWSIIYSPGFDYITQRPDHADGAPGEMMIGGGFFRSRGQGLDQVGVWDDGRTDVLVGMHIRGAMAAVFEPRWDACVKRAWTGILGVTGDWMPLVGRVPSSAKPSTPSKTTESSDSETAQGIGGSGEWIAAGFNGEGMVWAWLCGAALGIMIWGKEEEEELAPCGHRKVGFRRS